MRFHSNKQRGSILQYNQQGIKEANRKCKAIYILTIYIQNRFAEIIDGDPVDNDDED